MNSDSNKTAIKMLTTMVSIGVICAVLIVGTYEGTFERIALLKEEALNAAIFKVVPGITSTEAYVVSENGELIDAEGHDGKSQLVYAGYNDQGHLKGVAVEASGQGYADVLRILYGYDPVTQKIVGFHVLESKETPGLGDKIEKDAAFLENFKALDVTLNEEQDALLHTVVPVKNGEKANPWEVDGITGATISSRAIGNIIGESGNALLPIIFRNKEGLEKSSNKAQEN